MDHVETKLRELIGRLNESEDDAKGALRTSLEEPRVLALRVTDLELDYWTVLEDGAMADIATGGHDEAHIRIHVTSEDLVALVDGELKLVPAFLSGRVRVEASIADMLQLRKML